MAPVVVCKITWRNTGQAFECIAMKSLFLRCFTSIIPRMWQGV